MRDEALFKTTKVSILFHHPTLILISCLSLHTLPPPDNIIPQPHHVLLTPTARWNQLRDIPGKLLSNTSICANELQLIYCRLSFLDTFEVLVGSESNQKRFTLHHDIFTKRSRFFRVARSERWTPGTKPTDLHEYDPRIFNLYVYCVYPDALPSMPTAASSLPNNDNSTAPQKHPSRNCTGGRRGRYLSTSGTTRSFISTFSPIGCSTLPRQTWRSMGSDALP